MKRFRGRSRGIAPDDSVSDSVPPDAARAGDVPTDEPWSRLNIAAEPDGIRLAGSRVLSLDRFPSPYIAIPEPAFERHIDWKALALALGFTQPETRLFLAHWRDGVPVSRLSRRLKLSPHLSWKLYATVRDKLGISGPAIAGCLSIEPIHDSLRPAFRQRLRSGARPWSLGDLGKNFAEIMYAEKFIPLISDKDPREFQKSPQIWAGRVGAPMNKLTEQLKTETARSLRISEKLHALRLGEDETDRELRAVEHSLGKERAQAVLEDRQPDTAAFEKQLARLQTALRAKQVERTATETALRQQCGVVETLAAEIAAGAREATLKLITPKMVRFVALQNEAMKLAREVMADCAGQNVYPADLFPGTVVCGEVDERMAQFNATLRLFNYHSSWTNSPFYIEREHIGGGFFIEKRPA